MWKAILVFSLALGLASGCSRNREPDLLNFKQTEDGPDEFNIVPTKPLAQPEDYSALPEPTPGQTSLADPTPQSDAVAALGGRPGVLNRGSTDGSLVRHAGRYGVAPGIREQLAAADKQYRRDNDGRFLERVFKVNVYFDSYAKQSLDQYRELERFRRAGIRTPQVPPSPELQNR